MEPKFQSSFIPKGPVGGTNAVSMAPAKDKSILGIISWSVFFISLVLGVVVFGYKMFLNYSIDKMGRELEEARASIASEELDRFIRLDNRIVSTKQILSKHRSLSPLLEFLEESTLKNVRFTSFDYSLGKDGGTELLMQGQARGYAALALQADVFNKSKYFKNSNFSNLNLDERGDVSFSFTASVDPALVSYEKKIERQAPLQPASPTQNEESSEQALPIEDPDLMLDEN